jgi:hypothetical protein
VNLSRLIEHHATQISEARWHERCAERYAANGEQDAAEMARDRAAELRGIAADLAALLEPHGVNVPDPRQLSLLSDGGALNAR